MNVIGVDCHKAMHAAVVVNAHGQACGERRCANTRQGWEALIAWAAEQDDEVVWAIEGSGQYGRGLAQVLVRQGAVVWEVNPRLTAQARGQGRIRGKNDRVDAVSIARVAQREGTTLPQVQVDDASAVIAVHVAARERLLGDLTAMRNQLHQHLVQLEPIRTGAWPRLTSVRGVMALRDLAVPGGDALVAVHALQVRLLAERMLLAMEQIDRLTHEIEEHSRAWTGPLQAIVGVGPLTAGMLAGHLGGRAFASDAHLAMYAGIAPLEASSAGHTRHRLNRTGNRHLNAIVHRIALSQCRHSPQARAYLAKKRGEGKTREEAVRCLKRLLIRCIYTAWNQCQVPQVDPSFPETPASIDT